MSEAQCIDWLGTLCHQRGRLIYIGLLISSQELSATPMTHVLVIEDDPVTSREIEAALQDHGFDVTLVNNGREGLLAAISDTFDIIVLDRMLPGALDGLGMLTALRASGIYLSR